MSASISRKIVIRIRVPHPHDTFTRAGSQRSKASQGEAEFLPGTSRENICHMMEQSSPGKARGHPGCLLQAQGGQGNMVHRARIDEAVLYCPRLARQDDAARLGRKV